MPPLTRAFYAFLLLAAVPPMVSAAPSDPFLVVPGRSLGRLHLGQLGGADIKRLPTPGGSYTSKRGVYHAAWKSKTSSDTLAVTGLDRSYLAPARPGLEVDEIRATSPQFHTVGGLAPGATLAEIKRQYPKGRLRHAINGSNEGPDEHYDVSGKGLGFEFPAHPTASTRSIAVAVVEPSDEATLSAQGVQGYLEK